MKVGRLGAVVRRVGWLSLVALPLGYVGGCADAEEQVAAGGTPSQGVGQVASARGWQAQTSGRFSARLVGARALTDGGSLLLEGLTNEPAPSLTVVGIGRGVAAEAALLPARAVPRAGSLHIERGAALERLHAVPGGVEQSWAFENEPSGDGDLVVRVRTSGLRALGVDERGLRFAAGERQVRYSHAKWIDAHGVETPINARYSRGDIVISVPDDLLEASAYPALLDPTVSTEMVLTEPTYLPGGTIQSVDLDCSSTQCLFAWMQFEGGVVARRANLDGSLLDHPVLPLGRSIQAGNLTASSAPSKHQVIWRNVDEEGAASIVGVEIDGGSGALSDVPPATLFDEPDNIYPLTSSYGNGVHLVVIEETGTYERTAYRVVSNAIQAPATGIDLGTPLSNYNDYALTSGPNQFAWVEGNTLRRIDSTTGAVLDASPIVYSKWGRSQYAGTPTVSYDGANYVVVWHDSGNLFAARVRASDGVLLDPDDEFNQLPGARLLCKATALGPAAHVANGKLHVAYTTLTSVFASASFSMDPWSSSTEACAINTVHYQNPMPAALVKQVGAGGAVILQYSDGLRSLGYTLDANGAASTTNNQVLNYRSPYLHTPQVSSNGRDFLVGGQEQETNNGLVSHVDGATGEVTPVDIGVVKSYVLTAASGPDYLLTYGEKARKLSCSLNLGAEKGLPNGQGLFALRGDGSRYYGLVGVGSLSGYRLDLDGNYLEPSKPLNVGTWYSGGLSLAADTTPSADMRTFVVVVRTAAGVQAVRIRSATGSVLVPTTISNTPVDSASRAIASSDGTNVLVAWDKWVSNLEPHEFWGASFNPLTGVVSAEKELSAPVRSNLSFDGTSHLDLWYEYGPGNRLRRLDASFDSADPADGVQLPPTTYQDAFASNEHGRTLAVYRAFRPEHLGFVYAGAFIDNELASSDPDTTPSVCVDDGTGGEGGAGGEGGTPGAAGTTTGGTTTGGTTTGGTAGGGGEGGQGEGGAAVGGASDGGSSSAGAPDTGVGGQPAAGGAPSGEGGTPDVGNAGTAGASVGGNAGNAGTAASGASGGTTAGASSGGANAGSSGSSGGSKDSGGCGCRTAPSSPSPAWPMLLGLLALVRRRARAQR